jgi:hypothetical protein
MSLPCLKDVLVSHHEDMVVSMKDMFSSSSLGGVGRGPRTLIPNDTSGAGGVSRGPNNLGHLEAQ